MSNWFQLQATEERINYLAFFYKFVTEFVKHFDKWNLNSDWKIFKNIKIFPTLYGRCFPRQSQYGRCFPRGTDDSNVFAPEHTRLRPAEEK